nr:5-oxoprolinase subunit PxpA [Streptomyces triticisoli]
MESPVIDLNSDLGEGFGQWQLGDDEALLSLVTSANVACGFHAGDPTVMRRICEAAAERGVAIGAQVGYRDLAGFGRRFIDVDPAELVNDVVYQIAALDGFARLAGIRVAYVKPHGALYNAIVHHEAQAAAVAEAVRRYDPELPVLGLPGSVWLRTARAAGLTPVHEAFADRAYTPEGTLVPRREPGAVLHDPEVIVRRCLRMVTEGVVEAVDGSDVPLSVRSLCVHGDTADAVAIARRLREELERAGLAPTPFAVPKPLSVPA